MRNRIKLTLSYCAAGLFAVYLTLIVATVYFATWQTELAHSIRETEMAIGELETSYYKAISQLNGVDPYSVGFVTPSTIGYVVDTGPSGLSQATR